MKIIICDDNEKECTEIRRVVSESLAELRDISFDIKSFFNPFDVLDDVKENGAPDIALLDICMPGIMGTEIAREFISGDGNCTDIIFLTSSKDFAVEAFELHAKDYIVKPYTEEKLAGAVKQAAEKRRSRVFVTVQCGNDIHRIDIQQILYAEARNHNVEISLITGELLKTRMTLTELRTRIESMHGFIAVGASYIVNLRFVKSVLPDSLRMENEDLIPVPRRMRSELKKRYFDFYMQEVKR